MHKNIFFFFENFHRFPYFVGFETKRINLLRYPLNVVIEFFLYSGCLFDLCWACCVMKIHNQVFWRDELISGHGLTLSPFSLPGFSSYFPNWRGHFLIQICHKILIWKSIRSIGNAKRNNEPWKEKGWLCYQTLQECEIPQKQFVLFELN